VAENKIGIGIEVSGNAEDQLKKLTSATIDFQQKAVKSFSLTQRAFETFTGVLSANLVTGAFKAAADAITGFAKTLIIDGVAAAQVQENAVVRLNQALATTGEYTKESSQAFLDWASALQPVVGVGDEVILNLAALAKGFGFNAEQTKRVTEAAIEFSQVAGISLEESLRRIGRSAGGSIEDLAKFVPELKGLTKEQLAAGQAADIIIKKFGGSAAAATKTFSGQVQVAKNAFGDLTEEIGNAIIQNQAFNNVTQELNKLFQQFATSIVGDKNALKEFVAEGLILLIDASIGVAKAFDFILRAASVAFNGVKQQILSFVSVAIAAIAVFKDEYKVKLAEINAEIAVTKQKFADAFSEETFVGKLIAPLERLKVVAQEGFQAIQDGATGTIEIINQQQEITDQLTQAEIEAVDEQLRRIQLLREENRLSNEEEIAGLEQKLATNYKVNTLIAKDSEKLSNKELELRIRLQKAEEKINEARLQGASTFFGGLASLTQTKNKELFEIGKAAAVAQAIIDGALAVQKALAAFPPPFNFLAATGVAVKTGVQIATITSQALQQGGEIPSGFPNDTFPARLTSGENVVDRSTNERLKEFLGNTGGLAERLDVISDKISMLETNVVVNVGGENLVNIMRAQLESGRILVEPA